MYPSASMLMPRQCSFLKLLAVGRVSDLPDSAFIHKYLTCLSPGITEIAEY